MPRYIIRCRWRGRSSYRHFADKCPEAGAVIRCPECSAEIDVDEEEVEEGDRKSTRLNSSHVAISYAVFCLKKKKRHLCTLRQRWTAAGDRRPLLRNQGP